MLYFYDSLLTSEFVLTKVYVIFEHSSYNDNVSRASKNTVMFYVFISSQNVFELPTLFSFSFYISFYMLIKPQPNNSSVIVAKNVLFFFAVTMTLHG